MIDKERLEELINQGATIFVDNEQIVYEITLDCFKNIDIINNVLYCGIEIIPLNNIFETKYEAEWFKEFGCIERVERLELPTYEDVMKDLNGKIGTFVIAEDYKHNFAFEVFLTNKTGLENQIHMTGLRDLELTKENYTLACRKCKELFLKGDINDGNN